MLSRTHQLKKIFVCSAFSGAVEKNLEKARKYARKVIDAGHIPFVPHLLYPQFLDDNVPEERRLGMQAGMLFLAVCDELWVFGASTSGMQDEIAEANRLKIPVVWC